MKKKRPTKDQYLLDVAFTVAKRATCPDLHVGCVIATEDGHILATGYNGVQRGSKHCKEKDGKCLENGPLHRTIHAEVNAVCQAARVGTRLYGGIAYVTVMPCKKCASILFQAGIIKTITPESL